MLENISSIRKRKLDEIVNPILSENTRDSQDAGLKLSKEAYNYGLNLKDFLDLAVDMTEGEEARMHNEAKMSGFEMVCAKMNIPMKNDFRNQITLAQASDTFATKPGSRILFPYTIDSVLRWEDRLNNLENVEDLIASSRTIRGTELIRIVGEDDEDDRKTFTVSEGGKIPVRKVRTSSRSVDIYKHGSGMEFTYEFERRNSLDMITPFAARIERDLNRSKMASATHIMINGDGVNPAATAVTGKGASATSKLTYDMIVELAVKAVKENNPIDTLCGDIDTYCQLMTIFGTAANSAAFDVDQKAQKGAPQFMPLRNIFLPIKFVLNSNVPAGKLLAFNKAETIEEVVEAGSRIAEEERAVTNQVITYVRSENAGYSLIYPKTRYLLSYKTA